MAGLDIGQHGGVQAVPVAAGSDALRVLHAGPHQVVPTCDEDQVADALDGDRRCRHGLGLLFTAAAVKIQVARRIQVGLHGLDERH